MSSTCKDCYMLSCNMQGKNIINRNCKYANAEKEFKIKDLNNMTEEEMLWALKKIPRNDLNTHSKTLLIGCIESLKNKINKGEQLL